MNNDHTLDRIDRKLDDVIVKLERLSTTQKAQHNSVTDHEGRIRAIERGRWPTVQIAVLLALVTAVVTAFGMFR